MANNLNDARKSLLKAKESAQARLEQIENERKEIKASIKSLDSALKALNKNAPRKVSSNSQSSSVQNGEHTES